MRLIKLMSPNWRHIEAVMRYWRVLVGVISTTLDKHRLLRELFIDAREFYYAIDVIRHCLCLTRPCSESFSVMP